MKFAYYMCILFAKSDDCVKNFDERKPKQEESDLVLKLRDDIDTNLTRIFAGQGWALASLGYKQVDLNVTDKKLIISESTCVTYNKHV